MSRQSGQSRSHTWINGVPERPEPNTTEIWDGGAWDGSIGNGGPGAGCWVVIMALGALTVGLLAWAVLGCG